MGGQWMPKDEVPDDMLVIGPPHTPADLLPCLSVLRHQPLRLWHLRRGTQRVSRTNSFSNV